MTGAVIALSLTSAGSRPLSAQLSQEEALAQAFPRADSVHRATAYLDAAQRRRAGALAGDGAEVEAGIVTYYVGFEGDRPTGVAWFDAHRVRTHREVLMVVVGPDARLRRVEVVRFDEPPDYRAPKGWLGLMEGRGLDDDLSLKGKIPRITGATLTSRAATAAVRRALALQQVVDPLGRTAGSPR